DPVSENEYKLMLKQLGLSEKFKPKNGHRITCDAEAFCETYSNGKTNHWLEVQVTKSVRRLFSFDKFQEIDINEEGAKFHFDFSLKERNTDNNKAWHGPYPVSWEHRFRGSGGKVRNYKKRVGNQNACNCFAGCRSYGGNREKMPRA
ncbi:MAG: hypothetical protein IJW38_04555, partial [Clostridia bacterium]|nr:hypothetical protein [Clostridia bacterium]